MIPRKIRKFLDKNFVVRVSFMNVNAKTATTTKQNMHNFMAIEVIRKIDFVR